MADTTDTTRPAKGWWTYIFALLLVIAGQMQTWDWASLVNAKNAGWIVTGIGVVVAIFRTITNTPPASAK